ncbi:MAG TPA: CHAT domain-containing protein [Longimicrobium sp.]
MKKAKVLFFSADPLSINGENAPRLQLDAEARAIREKVRASEHRDSLVFDYRLAVRADDLLQALNEVQPDVVHFSGHGWSEGLFLMDPHGQGPQRVDSDFLVDLFRIFRGKIRVVVLNACLTEAQAKAIAGEVGCAIGMRRKISDLAAITFGEAFYRALGFGHSLQTAFDQACLMLPKAERDCPQLVERSGVDASNVFVVEPLPEPEPVPRPAPSPKKKRRRTGGGAVVIATVAAGRLWPGDPPACASAGPPQAQAGPSLGVMSGVQSDFARAKRDYEAGRYAVAFPRFRRSAESGNLEAMGFLGAMFLHGQGTPVRPDSAVYWLRRAAYDRDPQAMTTLGWAYENGQGVQLSLVRAREWYHKAADEKHWAEAMRRLGALSRREQDHAAALTWFQRAMKAGSADARVDIGELYEQGQGAPRDLETAVCFYRTGAEGGSVRGMLIMARIYRNGLGVSRDYDKARVWYENATRKGSPEAMYALGELYRDGLGVPRDTAQAAVWFANARAAGWRN